MLESMHSFLISFNRIAHNVITKNIFDTVISNRVERDRFQLIRIKGASCFLIPLPLVIQHWWSWHLSRHRHWPSQAYVLFHILLLSRLKLIIYEQQRAPKSHSSFIFHPCVYFDWLMWTTTGRQDCLLAAIVEIKIRNDFVTKRLQT